MPLQPYYSLEEGPRLHDPEHKKPRHLAQKFGTLLRFWRLVRMLKQDNAKHERAERLFKTREERKADAPKATAEYYAAQQKLLARTRELRQLRLQREAQMKSRSA